MAGFTHYCPVCGVFFWADRQDRSACSPTCHRVLREAEERQLGLFDAGASS